MISSFCLICFDLELTCCEFSVWRSEQVDLCPGWSTVLHSVETEDRWLAGLDDSAGLRFGESCRCSRLETQRLKSLWSALPAEGWWRENLLTRHRSSWVTADKLKLLSFCPAVTWMHEYFLVTDRASPSSLFVTSRDLPEQGSNMSWKWERIHACCFGMVWNLQPQYWFLFLSLFSSSSPLFSPPALWLMELQLDDGEEGGDLSLLSAEV